MVKRSLLTLLVALAILLPINPPVGALPLTSMTLAGRVILQSGNQMPGPRTPSQRPGAGTTVVAIGGYVAPQQPGQPFLAANALKAPIVGRARSDHQGRFTLTLPAIKVASSSTTKKVTEQHVTLLLVVPGGYYLNRFDAQGRFASIKWPISADQAPILLIDDRGATF
jgi:hypothetical protein